MRVAISEGWAVFWKGEQVSAGELDVDDETGRHWCARGWASEAPAKKTPPRR
jgi:hypothetical protein